MAQRISDMSAGSMPYAREALPYASLQRGLGGMNPPNPGMTNMDDGRLDPFLNAQTERQNQYEMQDINQNMTSARPQAAAGAMGQARTAIVEESDAQSKAQQDLNNKMAMVIEARGSGQNICLLYTSPSPRDLSTSRMPSSA